MNSYNYLFSQETRKYFPVLERTYFFDTTICFLLSADQRKTGFIIRKLTSGCEWDIFLAKKWRQTTPVMSDLHSLEHCKFLMFWKGQNFDTQLSFGFGGTAKIVYKLLPWNLFYSIPRRKCYEDIIDRIHNSLWFCCSCIMNFASYARETLKCQKNGLKSPVATKLDIAERQNCTHI